MFNGEYSYFGKLLTKQLTKIVNLAAYKNTGAGISMATKNMGYGSLCNTGRLHAPLFFNVCTEVLAAPVVREKLVLNVTDGLRAQYDGGPDKNAQFVYPNHSLYFATDPFALDMICHRQLVAKRKEMGDRGEREPAVHRLPALRGAAGAGHRGTGEDHLREGVGAGRRAGRRASPLTQAGKTQLQGALGGSVGSRTPNADIGPCAAFCPLTIVGLVRGAARQPSCRPQSSRISSRDMR